MKRYLLAIVLLLPHPASQSRSRKAPQQTADGVRNRRRSGDLRQNGAPDSCLPRCPGGRRTLDLHSPRQLADPRAGARTTHRADAQNRQTLAARRRGLRGRHSDRHGAQCPALDHGVQNGRGQFPDDSVVGPLRPLLRLPGPAVRADRPRHDRPSALLFQPRLRLAAAARPGPSIRDASAIPNSSEATNTKGLPAIWKRSSPNAAKSTNSTIW